MAGCRAASSPDSQPDCDICSTPTAFGWALREDEDQKERSSYIRLLRQEGKAEKVLSEDNFRRLRAMFDGQIDPEFADEHIRILSGDGALTGALNWYRAMTRDFGDLAPTTVPTTYVWSTGDSALGRAGAERCGEFVDAPYEFVVLEGGSHWIPEERAGELADAIIRRAGA